MKSIIIIGIMLLTAGCFDTGRMRINDQGEEIVENFKLPDKATFVGPPSPSDADLLSAQSFTEGKKQADVKFRQTINQIATISYFILIPLAIGLIVASFLTRLIPTKAGVSCGIAVGVVALSQNLLLKYGTIAVDVLAICIAILLGLAFIFGVIPVVIYWVKARIKKNGIMLAEEGKHVEGATAVIASVDPKAFKERKLVQQWLDTYHNRGVGAESSEEAQDIWNEARMQLVKLGVLKPVDK